MTMMRRSDFWIVVCGSLLAALALGLWPQDDADGPWLMLVMACFWLNGYAVRPLIDHRVEQIREWMDQ